MVNRYLTKNSASLATTKCKIEADLKLHFILVRMAITKKQMTIPAKDLLEEPLFATGLCYGNYCTMEISMDASQNTEGRTYMSQSCVILGCMLRDLKSVSHRDICSSTFITALFTFITAFFTIARKRNQPKSSSAEECETCT